MGGQLLANAHYPQRSSQVIATDAADRADICGLNRGSGLECAVFVPGGGRPIWQVVLAEAGKMNGGVLAPGRLYVTNADGVLCAIGDQ